MQDKNKGSVIETLGLVFFMPSRYDKNKKIAAQGARKKSYT